MRIFLFIFNSKTSFLHRSFHNSLLDYLRIILEGMCIGNFTYTLTHIFTKKKEGSRRVCVCRRAIGSTTNARKSAGECGSLDESERLRLRCCLCFASSEHTMAKREKTGDPDRLTPGTPPCETTSASNERTTTCCPHIFHDTQPHTYVWYLLANLCS